MKEEGIETNYQITFNSKESLERLVNGAIENIKAFTKEKPQNIVK
jgi:hypothetical protein